MLELIDRKISFPLQGGTCLQIPADRVAIALLEQLLGREEFAVAAAPVQPYIPAAGELWPGQGGHFTCKYEHAGKTFALITSPKEAEARDTKWATGYTRIAGAESDWDGAANTKAMIESGIDCPAARICTDLEIEGHRDYFLMARFQAYMAFMHAPQLFSKGWHHTSTQYAGYSGDAWCQYFSHGSQDFLSKLNELFVRPVRVIQLQ